MRGGVALLVLLLSTLPVFAVTCPPGFHWDRMSGVGCVQDDCAAKGGGYTYTQECWCGDKKRACYEYVNYTALGFDAKLCKPDCPVSKFIGCADADGKCPGDQPTTQTPQECDTNYCISYQGPYAKSVVMNGHCYCSCKDGYSAENSQILLCQPTKATCDAYCKSYHGGDRVNGDSAYGTVMGVDCDCHCNKGYVPDKTLTCVKAANCQDVCLKQMGEGAIASGTYPNCNCDCDKGYTKVYNYKNEWKLVCKKVVCPKNSTFDKKKGECVCDKGFYPTPKDGVCIKQITKATCGNNHCDIEPKEGAVVEDCEFCPQDCPCANNEVCNVNHPNRTIQNMGCIKAAAQILWIGCLSGEGAPTVMLKRAGQQNETEASIGAQLNEGDEITLSGAGKNFICMRPYVDFQWGSTKARLLLGSDNPFGTITIKKDAVESGWPSTAERAGHEAWSALEIIATVIEYVPLHVLHFFTSPDTLAEPDLVKVYLESHIIINQTQQGIKIYTLEGGPVVEYRGKNTTVSNGTKVTVDKNGVSTPVNFTPAEVGDWFLRIPSPPAEQNSNANGGGNTAPDLSGITSQLKNTCCGSVGMIGLLLVVAACGEKRRR